jgi:hypothetical protein
MAALSLLGIACGAHRRVDKLQTSVEEWGAGAFLIDDLEGREEAMHHGIEVTGTLGILKRATPHMLRDLPAVVAPLQRQIVWRTSRLIRIRTVRGLRSIFWVVCWS